MVEADGGEKEILIAVVVVVAHGGAHPVEADGKPPGCGHLGEVAVSVVSIEGHGRLLPAGVEPGPWLGP